MKIQSLRSIGIQSFIVSIWLFIFIFAIYIINRPKPVHLKKTLNLLVWAQVLDADYLRDFEKKTGVKVNLNYFASNEEVYAKLRSTPLHGYDLIMPSDYMVAQMISEGMLKKIDKTRLTFWKNMYRQLVGIYADPRSEYSIPYYWSIFGLGVDRSILGDQVEETWGLLFDPAKIHGCITILDNPREYIQIAAKYLFGEVETLSDEQIEYVKKFLIKQKKWVSLYTDLRPDFAIAARTCPVGLIGLNDFLKVMKEFEDLDFIIPKEGTFIVLDSFVVPSESNKDEIIYEFLNYLYSPDVLKKYVERYQFLAAVDTVKLDSPRSKKFLPSDELFSRISFFKKFLPKKTLHDIWIAVKAD